MVRLRVREVAEAQGILDAAKLGRRCNLGTATAYRLWQGDPGGLGEGERSVGIGTLARVARCLGVRLSDIVIEEVEEGLGSRR